MRVSWISGRPGAQFTPAFNAAGKRPDRTGTGHIPLSDHAGHLLLTICGQARRPGKEEADDRCGPGARARLAPATKASCRADRTAIHRAFAASSEGRRARRAIGGPGRALA